MQSSAPFPSSRPLPRSRPLAPPSAANDANRASNALRASVLDVALQLGIGNNNLVTNWMFNNSLEEEEEPHPLPDLTRSPNTSEESSTWTSPYTTAPSYLNFHSPSQRPKENPYSTEKELTAFKDLLDSSGFTVSASGPVGPPSAPVHAAITFPDTLSHPVTPKKLRKKRTGGDGYESDGGYVSESGKKKDASAGGEIKDKEERKRKKSLAAITKAAVAATSSKKDKDSPHTTAAGYETDATTPSKAPKSKDKKKKKSKADPDGVGYETDAGYISSAQTPSKAKRFFRLGSKASKPDLRPETNGNERLVTTEPLPLPPIAGKFATTLGSRAPSPHPPPVPIINPFVVNSINSTIGTAGSAFSEPHRESYASAESGSSGAGLSATSHPASPAPASSTFKRRFGFLNRDPETQPSSHVPVSPHSPLITEVIESNPSKPPIISLPLHRPATSPVSTAPTTFTFISPSFYSNLEANSPRRPGTAEGAFGPQGLRLRAPSPSPSPSPTPSPLLTPSSYVMVPPGEELEQFTPVPEATTSRGRPNLKMQTEGLKKSPTRNGPIVSPSAYHDIPPPSPAPLGPLPSVPLSPPSAGPSPPLLQRGRELPFPAKPLNMPPSADQGTAARVQRYQGLPTNFAPGPGRANVGLPTSPSQLAKMTGIGPRRPVRNDCLDMEPKNPTADLPRQGDEDDEYGDSRELRDVLDRFSEHRAQVLSKENEAALGRRRSFEELKIVEQTREQSGLSEDIIDYYEVQNAKGELASRKQVEQAATNRRPLFAEVEEEGDVIDDDDRSHYPDDRETLYYEEDLPDFPMDVRNSRWTESIYSRASILDSDKSESTRERFLRRIGEMYDENGREKIPPVPPLPSSIPPVPMLPHHLEFSTPSKTRGVLPEATGSAITPGRRWNRF